MFGMVSLSERNKQRVLITLSESWWWRVNDLNVSAVIIGSWSPPTPLPSTGNMREQTMEEWGRWQGVSHLEDLPFSSRSTPSLHPRHTYSLYLLLRPKIRNCSCSTAFNCYLKRVSCRSVFHQLTFLCRPRTSWAVDISTSLMFPSMVFTSHSTWGTSAAQKCIFGLHKNTYTRRKNVTHWFCISWEKEINTYTNAWAHTLPPIPPTHIWNAPCNNTIL